MSNAKNEIQNSLYIAQTEKALFSVIDATIKAGNKVNWTEVFNLVKTQHPASTLAFSIKYVKFLSPDDIIKSHIEKTGNLGDLARGILAVIKDNSVEDKDYAIADKILETFSSETKVNKDSTGYYLRSRYVRFLGYMAEMYPKFKNPDAAKWFKFLNSFIQRQSISKNITFDAGGNLIRWKALPGMEKYSAKIDQLMIGSKSVSDLFIDHYEKHGNMGLAEEWIRTLSSIPHNANHYDVTDVKTFIQRTARFSVLFTPDEKEQVVNGLCVFLDGVTRNHNRAWTNSFKESEIDFLWKPLLHPVFETNDFLEEKFITSIAPLTAFGCYVKHKDRISPSIWNYFAHTLEDNDLAKFFRLTVKGDFPQISPPLYLDKIDEITEKFFLNKLSDKSKMTACNTDWVARYMKSYLETFNPNISSQHLPRTKLLVMALALCSQQNASYLSTHIKDLVQKKKPKLKDSQILEQMQVDPYYAIGVLLGDPIVNYLSISNAVEVFKINGQGEEVIKIKEAIYSAMEVENNAITGTKKETASKEQNNINMEPL